MRATCTLSPVVRAVHLVRGRGGARVNMGPSSSGRYIFL